MKVSVIVPVYNVEKYLRKCLDSLVNQTLKDIEIIVVNDGSPDNCQSIIDEYVKKYPKMVRSFIKENGGQGSARNLGLDYINGEFVSFVDSDDWLDINTLKIMYDIAKKEKSDVVICDMIDHYEDGTKKIYNCTKYNWVYEVTPSACNKLFSREVIGDLKFLNGEWYEDFNFTTKILLKKNIKISTISKPFYHCHSRKVSTMSNNNSLKNLDMITVLDDLKKYAKENNCYDENVFSFLIFHHIMITSINRVALQKNKDVKRVIESFVQYSKKNNPRYKKMPFYQTISKKRKLIAWLNCNNMYFISKFLLKIKSII